MDVPKKFDFFLWKKINSLHGCQKLCPIQHIYSTTKWTIHHPSNVHWCFLIDWRHYIRD
jgi:hypothetical protein